jgi:(E)-4-hydroxy-3-methylbut-2-enyl-diphosphate synthase
MFLLEVITLFNSVDDKYKYCDVVSTVNQIKDLELAGADIVRVSVPGFDEANAFKEIKKAVNIPLVADIHFDYKIA